MKIKRCTNQVEPSLLSTQYDWLDYVLYHRFVKYYIDTPSTTTIPSLVPAHAMPLTSPKLPAAPFAYV
jgi:hypothetical protein